LFQSLPQRTIRYTGNILSGAGKTTLLSNLSDKYRIVSFDKDRSRLDEVILETLISDKVTIVDVPILISTLYKKYHNMFNIDMVFLIEDDEVIKDRLLKRGGKVNNSKARSKRVKSLAKKYASFTGNYEKVLFYLR
jgi:deoxyadenosine/deoxycytidine kinase